MKHISYDFAFSTPGLLTGLSIAYVPTPGEFLLGGWLGIKQAWNGTTPKFDFGIFAAGGAGISANYLGGAIGLSGLPVDSDPSGILMDVPAGDGSNSVFFLSTVGLPLIFVTNDPLCVCVSQDGTPSGADPGSTTGRGQLHLLILEAE